MLWQVSCKGVQRGSNNHIWDRFVIMLMLRLARMHAAFDHETDLIGTHQGQFINW